MAIDVGKLIEQACAANALLLAMFDRDVASSLFKYTEDVKNLHLVIAHAEGSRHRISQQLERSIEHWLEEEFCGAIASRQIPRR